jgi:hypothetical protein
MYLYLDLFRVIGLHLVTKLFFKKEKFDQKK